MPYKHLIAGYICPMMPVPTPLTRAGTLTDKIECVLFDVYGTLFISGSGDINMAQKESHDRRCLKKLLKKYKINHESHLVLTEFYDRIETEHQTLRETGIDFPEIVIEKIWQAVLGLDLQSARNFAVEFEWIHNPVYLMPHLDRLLHECRKLNLLMGLISNAQFYTPSLFDWFLESNLEDLGFNPDITFFSYQFGYAKPSLHLFLLAREQLEQKKIPAHAVLYLGNDMLNDIYPAQKVGFNTALFAGDARSLRLRKDHPLCKNLSADLVITHLDQVTNFLT